MSEPENSAVDAPKAGAESSEETAAAHAKSADGESAATAEPKAASDAASPGGGEAAVTAESGAEGEPAKKKKKKKKKRVEAAEPAEPREELDENGRARPAFVVDFPKHPELDRLVRAFELGNYALVREQAPALAEGKEEERVRAAARELLRRIEPDPLVRVLLAMSVLFFLVIAFWAYRTHGH